MHALACAARMLLALFLLSLFGSPWGLFVLIAVAVNPWLLAASALVVVTGFVVRLGGGLLGWW